MAETIPEEPLTDRLDALMMRLDQEGRPYDAGLVREAIGTLGRPKVVNPAVVCLCGSTRFREMFEQVACDETLAGRIVLTVNDFDTARRQPVGHHPPTEEKTRLDELHLRKIDLADEVLILNVGGYIGESTRRELTYARRHGKVVRFLEPNLEDES